MADLYLALAPASERDLSIELSRLDWTPDRVFIPRWWDGYRSQGRSTRLVVSRGMPVAGAVFITFELPVPHHYFEIEVCVYEDISGSAGRPSEAGRGIGRDRADEIRDAQRRYERQLQQLWRTTTW